MKQISFATLAEAGKKRKIDLPGVTGYWLDRFLFPYARPDSFMVEVVPRGEAGDIDLDADCKLIPWEMINGDTPRHPGPPVDRFPRLRSAPGGRVIEDHLTAVLNRVR